MKHSLLIVVLLALMPALFAGDPPANTVTLAELTWYTSLEDAQKVAKTENLPILIDFTGSDWCIWCHRLDDEVFSKPEFVAYAKTGLILVQMDFPRGFKQLPAEVQTYRRDIQTRYNIEGYPTIVLVSQSGEEIGRLGYEEGGAAKWVDHVKAIVTPTPQVQGQ